MWKVVALMLAVFILGQLAVRYVRKNPLDPTIEGNQIAVESQDYRVHFQRDGAVAGTYFISDAKSEDWTSICAAMPTSTCTDRSPAPGSRTPRRRSRSSPRVARSTARCAGSSTATSAASAAAASACA